MDSFGLATPALRQGTFVFVKDDHVYEFGWPYTINDSANSTSPAERSSFDIERFFTFSEADLAAIGSRDKDSLRL